MRPHFATVPAVCILQHSAAVANSDTSRSDNCKGNAITETEQVSGLVHRVQRRHVLQDELAGKSHHWLLLHLVASTRSDRDAGTV